MQKWEARYKRHISHCPLLSLHQQSKKLISSPPSSHGFSYPNATTALRSVFVFRILCLSLTLSTQAAGYDVLRLLDGSRELSLTPHVLKSLIANIETQPGTFSFSLGFIFSTTTPFCFQQPIKTVSSATSTKNVPHGQLWGKA